MNYLLITLLFFISLFIRISNINYPENITWDEVYFVNFVKRMLSEQGYFTDHPPLGRLCMYVSTLIFGDNTIGWRASQVLIGTLLAPTAFFLAKALFQNKNAGLLTATFITFEPIFTLYSRIGVVDIFLIFFISVSLLLYISSFNKKNLFFFLACAICTGLTIAVKWIGLILIPIYLLWHICNKQSFQFQKRYYVTFFLILTISYLCTFSFDNKSFQCLDKKYNLKNQNLIHSIINWHCLALRSHTKEMSHFYSSKWYTWPLLYKPFWLDFKLTNQSLSNAKCLATIGNPLIWWGGLIALLIQMFLLIFRKNKITAFLIGSYWLSLIPYAFITRPMFIYHYIPALLFLILILEYSLLSLPYKQLISKVVVSIYLSTVIFLYFYFLPFVNGSQISYEEYHRKLWFESWKYKLVGWEWNLERFK